MGTAVVLMGSKSDFEHSKKIGDALGALGVKAEYRVASAHKTPKKVLEIIESLNARAAKGEQIVIIAVAGLSNALSGLAACATPIPIITCPPAEEDVMSSLRMPKGVAHGTVIGAENAALMAAKIIGLSEPAVAEKARAALADYARKVEDADAEAQRID